VYVLIADRIERQVLADRQVTATFIAAGARDLELPEVADALDDFDNWLAEPMTPRPVDPERKVLLEALGVRGVR
jgi:hypothetical protein